MAIQSVKCKPIAVIADIAHHRRGNPKPLKHRGTEEAEEKDLLAISFDPRISNPRSQR
jgi:hypothetical protein